MPDTHDPCRATNSRANTNHQKPIHVDWPIILEQKSSDSAVPTGISVIILWSFVLLIKAGVKKVPGKTIEYALTNATPNLNS